MKRRGFALLAVLWTVAALAAVVAVAGAQLRVGDRASANRITLARAHWAAEACAAIAQRRWAEGRRGPEAGIHLGRETRCSYGLWDPLTGLNPNFADSAVMARCFLLVGLRADSAAAWAGRIVQLRRSRPFESVEQFREWPGFPVPLLEVLTMEGQGEVSAAASAAVLLALPGMTSEAAAVLARRAQLGRPVTSLDELAGLVSPAAREALSPQYAHLTGLLVFTPRQLRLLAHGWIGREPAAPDVIVEYLVVPQPSRLAVVRRRA